MNPDVFDILMEMRQVNEMAISANKEDNYFLRKSKISCKTEDIGLESFLICLENKPQKCLFSIPFGNRYFCKKPLFME